MVRRAGKQAEFKCRIVPVPKKRGTNYNVALRSSPGANKSFKDRGNDFGNGPISIEPRRCLEKKATRSDDLLCSLLFVRNEA